MFKKNQNKKPTEKKAKKTKIKKSKRFYKKEPSDNAYMKKVTYWAFTGAVVLIVGGVGYAYHNGNQYAQKVLESAMPKGTQLGQYKSDGQSAQGTLTLNNFIISKDGKDLAAQISYDDTALKSLSGFGDKYKLWLLGNKGDDLSYMKLSYGRFNTDGDGVLHIHSDKGFKDKAFVVMIGDTSKILSSQVLQDAANGDTTNSNGSTTNSTDNTNLSDSDTSQINQSITAQLSGKNTQGDSKKQQAIYASMPMFYVRLNAHNATKVSDNFSHDNTTMLDDLFINNNIKSKKAQLDNAKKQVKAVNDAIAEKQQELAKNPQDENSRQVIDQLQGTLTSLNAKQSSLQSDLDTLKKGRDATAQKDILAPMQTKYTYKEGDLSSLNNS